MNNRHGGTLGHERADTRQFKWVLSRQPQNAQFFTLGRVAIRFMVNNRLLSLEFAITMASSL